MKAILILLLMPLLLSNCAHQLEDGTMSYLHAPKSWNTSVNPLDFPGETLEYTEEYIRSETNRLHRKNLKSFWYPYSEF